MPIDITLGTLCGEESNHTEEVDLEVKGVGLKKWSRALALHRVLVRSDFPTTLKDAGASRKDIESWEHLKMIDLPPSANTGVMTELLIGLDNPQALEPLEIRRGRDGSPFAVRTRLGWTINGPVGYSRLSAVLGCNVGIREPQKKDSPLEMQVRRFWELETEAERGRHSEERALSVDDDRVLRLWSSSIRVINNHYQLPIPFRHERPKFPDNRAMVEQRLAALRRRLLKDPHLHGRYHAEIQQLLDRGYAERVPAGEININPDYTWYLPHHPVFNPNKPEKVRIVFDCAAIYDSTSLNSEVLQGPDLTNKLLGILLRFRQGQVAVMADIEAMFHQVKVTPQHRDALRFLWWTEGDLSRKPCAYRMTVHPFGGVWSPSCAAYALQRTLIDKQREYPEVERKAKENFYVDDLLLSVDTTQEASTLSRQLRMVLAEKGFRLTKWMSNDKEVLASVPVQERHAEVKEIDFSYNKTLPTERALGVRWNLQTDQLAICANPGSKPATKRGLLSIVSSVYDPLGIVSPYTIRAKMIFQDECRRQREWDEPLTESNMREWELWKSGLKELAHLSIPRCYTQDMSASTSLVQLHHFCDASQKAYGVVSYLRFEDGPNNVHCAFVCGKAKLAPLKTQTIPRLELCAAVLAVKMDRSLQRELDIRVPQSIFWTDSMLVLQYIANTEKRFRTFVANRVSVIRDTSEPNQWRHVPTLLNPADDATRGLSASEMNQQSRWLTGPPFLWLEEGKWPDRLLLTADLVHDPEVISCTTATDTHMSDVGPEGKDLGLLWTHYSSWHRLQKGVAWIRRFSEWLRRKPDNSPSPSPLTVTQLRQARTTILRKVQQEHYAAETETLRHGALVPRTSAIYNLEPWLDKEGLLRVGGRLSSTHLTTQDGPILLPREHPVTELIIREVHQMLAGHSGREHTVALVRQNYWVPQIRRKVDSVLRCCFVCRRNNWKTLHQRQAPLPEERVTPGAAPFSSTGVDCFGPFLVKQGRKQFKRWGCIFTCMTTRAVHLEVLMSLDADAFLNALVRFSARRGVPTRLRSDNGTNMTAAERELRAVVRTWGEDGHVRATLLMKQIEWSFQPPQASHMGGVWERQIRTVRKVLRAIVGSQVLDDERLHTFLCEAEAVINSRPLTPASDDPYDLEALTPNHILRVGTHYNPPLGGATLEEQFRKRWKHVQYLADQFWKRWLREYLPRLRLRSGPIAERRNFKKGDLVIVTNEPAPRNQWQLGRIVHVQPGDDSIVRKVKVRTARNVLVRPVTKLCFLEGLDRH